MSNLRLVSVNNKPIQPSIETRCAAIVARAIMTESAPASFFSDEIKPKKGKPNA